MISAIDGNLVLVEGENGFKPYMYYSIHCTDSSDTKIKMKSVYQIKFNKNYELIAKINAFMEAKLLIINSKIVKDYLKRWLAEVNMNGGFYLQKNYIYSGTVGLPKKEEKFVKVSNDYFIGVKTAVNNIRDDMLYG